MNHQRSISTIAREIRADWKACSAYARPYLDAMLQIESVRDQYFADSAESVIRYFLCNAGSWRGDTARRVKAELKAMIK